VPRRTVWQAAGRLGRSHRKSAQCGVEVTCRVELESLESLGGIIGASRVVVERLVPHGRVLEPGGVVIESVRTYRRVVAPDCVANERVLTEESVTRVGKAAALLARRSRLRRKRKACERKRDEKHTTPPERALTNFQWAELMSEWSLFHSSFPFTWSLCLQLQV